MYEGKDTHKDAPAGELKNLYTCIVRGCFVVAIVVLVVVVIVLVLVLVLVISLFSLFCFLC